MRFAMFTGAHSAVNMLFVVYERSMIVYAKHRNVIQRPTVLNCITDVYSIEMSSISVAKHEKVRKNLATTATKFDKKKN